MRTASIRLCIHLPLMHPNPSSVAPKMELQCTSWGCCLLGGSCSEHCEQDRDLLHRALRRNFQVGNQGL